MPDLNPRIVAHAFNIEPGVKLVVQPRKIFHPNIEVQIV